MKKLFCAAMVIITVFLCGITTVLAGYEPETQSELERLSRIAEQQTPAVSIVIPQGSLEPASFPSIPPLSQPYKPSPLAYILGGGCLIVIIFGAIGYLSNRKKK